MVSRAVIQCIRLFQGMPLDCAWVRERLGGYLQSDLPDWEMPAIEDHVRRCPKCSADCEEVRRVGDWLAEEFLRQRGVTSSSEERVSAIMARIERCEAEFSDATRRLLREYAPAKNCQQGDQCGMSIENSSPALSAMGAILLDRAQVLARMGEKQTGSTFEELHRVMAEEWR